VIREKTPVMRENVMVIGDEKWEADEKSPTGPQTL
jgi:hypothetical protein